VTNQGAVDDATVIRLFFDFFDHIDQGWLGLTLQNTADLRPPGSNLDQTSCRLGWWKADPSVHCRKDDQE
jgi:hypothetical protein